MECIARQSTGSCCGDHRGSPTGGGADSELGGLGNWELETAPRAEPAGPRGKEAREMVHDWGPVCIPRHPREQLATLRDICAYQKPGGHAGASGGRRPGIQLVTRQHAGQSLATTVILPPFSLCRGPESLHPTSLEDTPDFQCKLVPHVGSSHLTRISASNLRHAPRAPGTPAFSLTLTVKRPETRGS